MKIQTLQSSAELEAGYGVLKELRTELTLPKFLSLYHSANKFNGYTLLAAVENESYVAIMGYRILYDFVHGKHLYIDDLAVRGEHQSQGIGAKLLALAETIAKEHGCDGLRLCTGKSNERAIRFYEREGWAPRAIAFKKAVQK